MNRSFFSCNSNMGRAFYRKLLIILVMVPSILLTSSSHFVVNATSASSQIPTPTAVVTTIPTTAPSPFSTPTPALTPAITAMPAPEKEIISTPLHDMEPLDISWIPENGLSVPDGWTGPVAYLTFDDGPCSGETLELLYILETYGIKATFFVIGKNISDRTASILAAITKNGHAVGNHTEDHLGVYKSLEHFKESVENTEAKIKKITGIITPLFRFPGGSNVTMANKFFGESVQFLNSMGMVYFDWNTSCGDGNNAVIYTPEALCQNVMNHVGGQKTMIVLMHDSHPADTERGRNLLASLPLIIRSLYLKGYRFSSLSAATQTVQFRKN